MKYCVMGWVAFGLVIAGIGCANQSDNQPTLESRMTKLESRVNNLEAQLNVTLSKSSVVSTVPETVPEKTADETLADGFATKYPDVPRALMIDFIQRTRKAMKESGTFKGATPPEFELRAVKDCIERYREDVLGIKPEWMQDKKESTPAPTRVTDPATKKPLIRPGG